MPRSNTATQNTPLAPSVEKAYYRKCIQLKRRLNEVEAGNDEAKVRRVRLERAVTKMRLERAFLLDALRTRMASRPDGPGGDPSDGSADEGMATPPPERPHRDKRRRTTQTTAPTDGAAGSGTAAAAAASPALRRASHRDSAAEGGEEGDTYGSAPTNGVGREAGAVGEALAAGQGPAQAPNGERRVVPPDPSRGGAGV